MHPEEIKAAIRMNNMTPAKIASEFNVTQSTLSKVIHKHSHSERIEARIAEIIGKPREEIFPRVPSLLRRSA
jgi:lambda repressor-like predicted transcriptional regulator